MDQIILARKMLRRNAGRNLFYAFSNFVSCSIVFVLMNMVFSDRLVEIKLSQSGEGNYSSLLFLALLYTIISNYYVSQIFYEKNKKDFGTLFLLGYSSVQIGMTALYQYMMVGFPSMVLSILFCRVFLVKALDTYLYTAVGYPLEVAGEVFVSTYCGFILMVLCMMTVAVLAVDPSVTGENVMDMFKRSNKKDTKYYNFLSKYSLFALVVFCYVRGLFSFIREENLAYVVFFGLVGSAGIMNFVLTDVARNLKRVFVSYQSYSILSHFIQDLRHNKLSCNILILTAITVVVQLSSGQLSLLKYKLAFIVLATLIVLSCVTLFSQFSISAKEKIREYRNLHLMGIERKKLMILSTIELILFYLVVFLIAGIYGFVTLKYAYIKGSMSVEDIKLFIFLFTIPYLMVMISTIILYIGRIKNMAGEKHE